jgi:hypothetical protein
MNIHSAGTFRPRVLSGSEFPCLNPRPLDPDDSLCQIAFRVGGGGVHKVSRYRVSEFENMLGILASAVLLMGFKNDRSGN